MGPAYRQLRCEIAVAVTVGGLPNLTVEQVNICQTQTNACPTCLCTQTNLLPVPSCGVEQSPVPLMIVEQGGIKEANDFLHGTDCGVAPDNRPICTLNTIFQATQGDVVSMLHVALTRAPAPLPSVSIGSCSNPLFTADSPTLRAGSLVLIRRYY